MGFWTNLVTTIREGLFTGPGTYDPDADLQADQGGSLYFRRLTQSERDLQPIIQERALQLVYWLWETNPMAKRIIELVKDFVIGEGLTVVAEGESDTARQALQDVVDDFWHDPINQMPLKLHDKIKELGLYGEQCYPIFVNPVNGKVRLGYIDPADVKDVIHDPENAEIAVAVIVKVKDSMGVAQKVYKIPRIDEDPTLDTYGRLTVTLDKQGECQETYKDGESTKRYDGYCFWFTVNKVSNARRGRSDLLTIADWLDGYDQFMFNEIDRSLLLKNFIWDVTWEGLSPDQVLEKAKTTPAPKPATVRHHNEKTTWAAVTPDLKTVDATNTADLILSYIATGAGLPKTWLNGTVEVNRATAAELGEPAFKRLAARQQYVLFILRHILTFVLDQAERYGRLPKRDSVVGLGPTAWPIVLQAPEMRSKDMAQASTSTNQTTQALATALADDLIDTDVAQQVLTVLFGQYGVDVDLEALRERLEKAKKEKADQAQVAPYPIVEPEGAEVEA